MSHTSSSYLALAIFPPRLPRLPGVSLRGVPVLPPALLAFIGAMFLVAPGDGAVTVDRVSLSLGLILAALVWVALILVVELQAAPARARRAGARPERA